MTISRKDLLAALAGMVAIPFAGDLTTTEAQAKTKKPGSKKGQVAGRRRQPELKHIAELLRGQRELKWMRHAPLNVFLACWKHSGLSHHAVSEVRERIPQQKFGLSPVLLQRNHSRWQKCVLLVTLGCHQF
jgi:hypothetical protein